MFDKLAEGEVGEVKKPVVETGVDKCSYCGGAIVWVGKAWVCEKCRKAASFGELYEPED